DATDPCPVPVSLIATTPSSRMPAFSHFWTRRIMRGSLIRLRNSVGAQDMNLCEAQWLAYAFPYRRFAVTLADDRARLRVDADRYSFIVSVLHRLLLTGFSGALRKIPYVILPCFAHTVASRAPPHQILFVDS